MNSVIVKGWKLNEHVGTISERYLGYLSPFSNIGSTHPVFCTKVSHWLQWRIQDFAVGAPIPEGDAPNHYFTKFLKNKRIWTERGDVPSTSLGSATDEIRKKFPLYIFNKNASQ